MDSVERIYGVFGAEERRIVQITGAEWRDSGASTDAMTVRGHAAVFNSPSLDLGGFTEYIAPGAFNRVLGENPDVLLLWDHDTRLPLARSAAKSLELRIDPIGLHFWARCTMTSYAQDLALCMSDGLINGASFGFTVADEEWVYSEDSSGKEVVTRTIKEVDALYDLTICAQPAYPKSDASLVTSRAYSYARSQGLKIPDHLVPKQDEMFTLDQARRHLGFHRYNEENARSAAAIDGLLDARDVAETGVATVAQDDPAGGSSEVERTRLALVTNVRRRRITHKEK